MPWYSSHVLCTKLYFIHSIILSSPDYTEISIDNIYYNISSIVPSAARVGQQVTITQHKTVTHSKSGDSSVNIVTSITHTNSISRDVIHTSRQPYPAFTDSEQEKTTDTVPSTVTTTARKSSQAVTLREAVAWALLSLMTLMLLFTRILSVVTIIRIQKQRQRQDSTVTTEAPAYEMDDNPCYENSKTDNTYGMHIYEPIETPTT